MNTKKNLIIILFLCLGMAFSSINISKFSLNSKSPSKIQEVMNLQNSYESSWIPNGIAICTANISQYEPQICSDRTGGAIITWYDNRSGSYDIYVQKINSSGNVQWITNGIDVCTETNDQLWPQICSDGTGGAIISWNDRRSGPADIYVQRINSSGNIQWNANGVPICTASNDQNEPQICSDGTGGAIIIWTDGRNGPPDIYVQRIDANGNIQWTADGVPICTSPNSQYLPQICSDGAGGAIISWYDNRSESYDIYVQKINSSGIAQWIPNGTAISTTINEQFYPQIYSDGAGGAIIAWQDKRTGTNRDIYAQKIDVNGNTQWIPNGTAICTTIHDQFAPLMCSDGLGGVIIIWKDSRSGSIYETYIQRIDLIGNIQWNANGVPICTASNDQNEPQICSDGTGGAIIIWTDGRNGPPDIYVQRIDANGNLQWNADGVPICTSPNSQYRPQICSNGAGGAILAWIDERSGLSDIYAHRVDAIQILNVEITNQIFSSNKFNITIFIHSDNHRGIEFATIQMWWNGINASADIDNFGGGFYLLSLDSIYVAPEEDPILLNMTISAEGYGDKYFETYLATIKKEESAIPGYNIILIIGLISVMTVVTSKIFIKKK